jgi:peptidoglycan/xylan/chitin deacetylase (PgdA/CDA1 family)
VLIRNIVRHGAVSALSCAFAIKGGFVPELARPRVQFICLHHVPAGMRVRFRKLLARLARQHSFISYSEAVRRVKHGLIDRPYLAFSSDDGFASDLMLAQVLEEFGTRGCFFVCPTALETANPAAFCTDRLRTAPQPLMNWKQVEQLLAAGHEIGSHTNTHADLGRIPAAEVEQEIFRARETLRKRCGAGDHFAWPFGRMRNFSRMAADIAFRAGHLSCASAIRGCHLGGWAQPERVYLWRDPIEPAWPLHHSLYFLAHNSRKAGHSIRILGAQHAAA